MKIRVGQGFDVHRFGEEIATNPVFELKLGGVAVPYERKLVAHSDGDVVIHALCDALLGAIGAGDIGKHFPDTDPRFENADSAELLRHVVSLARSNSWSLINADITVVAEAPRLAPFITEMKSRLALLLFADSDCVNIKATTSEGLGFTGRKEGIASFAVVLLEQSLS